LKYVCDVTAAAVSISVGKFCATFIFNLSPVLDGEDLNRIQLLSHDSGFGSELACSTRFLFSKPLSTSNGFGVQLTETISTAKWFWSPTHGNHSHNKMVLEYNSQKPFPQQNGFEVQLTETIPIAKPLDNYFGFEGILFYIISN
jgi:hypothetical protein